MAEAKPRNILPADPAPSHYEILLEPDLAEFTFAGECTITLKATQPTDTVVFNCSDITIGKVVVHGNGGRTHEVPGSEVAIDTRNDRGTVPLGGQEQGEFRITVTYTGVINDKMVGFYRSKYTHKGETKYMATTQMEAVDARRAFPCWDEPTHKATFSVSLIVPKGYHALSNMPEAGPRTAVLDAAKERVTFGRTPIMSTYLLAFVVSEHLACIERTIKKKRSGESTLVRVFATNDQEKDGEFALDVACKVLPLYEEFFGSDYILPKADLIAVPDFAAGAMENWGLITYRETALLANDKSAAKHRQWVALVVAHELAHQWFGNLVTMDWWKELWLNESFATWVEYWAVDQLFPTWEIFTQFVNDECGRAFDLDALKSSHPIEVDVVNAEEIDEIFDAISYCKGGSVLRMVVEFIGMRAFREGLVKYLDHFKFRNATTKDLWKFLGDAAHKDLTGILDDWIGKQGFPCLDVRQTSETQITVEQHRFLASGSVAPEDDQTVWQIPTAVRCGEGEAGAKSLVLTGRTSTVDVAPNAPFVLVNDKRAAFCRVHYDQKLLAALAAPIAARTVSCVDRMAIINDIHAFAISGLGSAADGVRLLDKSYRGETDAAVWEAVIAFEADVRSLLATDAEREKFNAWARALYKDSATSLGFAPRESDDHRDAQRRASIFNRLVVAKDEAALAAAAKYWEGRKAAERDDGAISTDLRGAVYAAMVRSDESGAALDELIETHQSSTDASEQARILGVIARGQSEALVQKAIDYALSDKVRPQDAFRVLVAASANPCGVRPFLGMLKDKKATLWAKLPGMLIGRVYKAVENFDDTSLVPAIQEAMGLLEDKERGAVDRSVTQGLEGLNIRAAWKARDHDAVVAAL